MNSDEPTHDTQQAAYLGSLAAQFRAWLHDVTADMSSIEALLALDDASLRAFADRYADAVSDDALRTLIDRSHGLLARTPADSVSLAHLAVRIVQSTFTSDPEQDAATEGDAWKAYTEALFAVGDVAQAEFAGRQADLFYGMLIDVDRSYERTILELTIGQVLHALGNTETGLRRISRAAAVLLTTFKLKRKYVDALTIYAAVLLDAGRVVEAASIFSQCAEIARQEGYTEPLGYMLNNVALCYVALGYLAKAKECVTAALDIFEDLKLTQKIPRARMTLAKILVQEGRYNEAISEMWKCRAMFLGLTMPIAAAEVTMRIVQVLFAASRYSEIPERCREAYETFRDAALPREALKALAYISEAARVGILLRERTAVTEGEVGYVGDFLQRLQSEPEAQWEAPRAEGN